MGTGTGQRRQVVRLSVAAAMVLAVLSVSSGPSRGDQGEFCNTTPILGVIGSASPPPPFASSPYPSTIVVSGLAGPVTDVNVTLRAVRTHPDETQNQEHFPEDLDILLVAPNNSNVMLMSDAGGENTTSHPVNGDLTFDDQAATALPGGSQIIAPGTYRPVDDENDQDEDVPVDTFPNGPTHSGSTSLSTFNGINPNGTWSLWVVDDKALAINDIAGGWCLNITTGTTPTVLPTTTPPTTTPPTTVPPTTVPPTTVPPTTTPPTTVPPTTTPPTTVPPTTTPPTTVPPTTVPPTTVPPTTTPPTTTPPTTTPPTTIPPVPPGGTCGGRTPTMVGTSGNDVIFGTPGPDVIAGGAGNDVIRGLGGDDVICNGPGDDTVLGGEGDDRLFGDAGQDLLLGENGNDVVSGGPGRDRLVGGAGTDSLNGDGDGDLCVGGDGLDTASSCERLFQVP